MSAAELTEAADFLEANGWLPTTLGTPAVEAVTTPLLPGDNGRLVAALRAAAAGTDRGDVGTGPEPTEADRMLAARLVVRNLRRESLQGAIAEAIAAAREEGRAEQLTADDRRSLAAVFGYELGLAEALHHDDKEPRP